MALASASRVCACSSSYFALFHRSTDASNWVCSCARRCFAASTCCLLGAAAEVAETERTKAGTTRNAAITSRGILDGGPLIVLLGPDTVKARLSHRAFEPPD